MTFLLFKIFLALLYLFPEEYINKYMSFQKRNKPFLNFHPQKKAQLTARPSFFTPWCVHGLPVSATRKWPEDGVPEVLTSGVTRVR